jgi:anti-anti-sigma factor
MTEHDFSVTQDEFGVYHLKGQLSIYQVEKLKDFLDDLLGSRKEVTLALDEVSLIDTAALQLIIAFGNTSHKHVKVQIASVSAEVDKVLTISGLGAAFLGRAT